MSSWKYSIKTIVRYAILQVPGVVILGILLWWFIELEFIQRGTAVLLILIWIVKEIILYHFLWEAYIPNSAITQDSLLNTPGKTLERLDPLGYVKIRGERWRGKALQENQIIPAGTKIVVVATDGLTVTVKPIE